MKHRLSWVMILTTAAFLPIMVFGQAYKWTDDQGQIHYGDQPPRDQDAEKIPVFQSSGESQTQPSPDDELQRILELAEELEEARETREQERLAENLAQLEQTYYRRLIEDLEEDEQPPHYRDERIVFPAFPYHPHPPFIHPPKKRPPHHGKRQPKPYIDEFSLHHRAKKDYLKRSAEIERSLKKRQAPRHRHDSRQRSPEAGTPDPVKSMGIRNP